MQRHHLLTTRAVCAYPVLIGLFLISSAAHGGGVLFVDDDAPLGGDGTTWDTAYRFLQDALADASGGGVSEVHVAQGTYKPDRAEANPNGTGDRLATFQLLNDVAVVGGFAGIGAKDPDARDFELYETILSGNIANQALETDNSYHVLRGTDIKQTAVLDGLTITAGYASGPDSQNFGGGVRADRCSLKVVDCRIIDNHAAVRGGGAYLADSPAVFVTCFFGENTTANGGGLYSTRADLMLTDCEFIDNFASQTGGGARVRKETEEMTVSITGCVFEGNSGNTGGGGLNADSTFMTVEECQFLANSTNASSGGGAVAFGTDQTTIRNCFFWNNDAFEKGGGLVTGGTGEISDCIFLDNFSVNHGGALSVGDPQDLPIVGCSFVNNSTQEGHGGAIYSPEVTGVFHLDVRDSEFISNSSQAWGGAIFSEDKSVTLENCLFEQNTSMASGGGACEIRELVDTEFFAAIACTFVGNSVSGPGGAISNRGNALIQDCLFEQNSSGEQGGGIQTSGQDVTVAGCVFIGNEADETGGGLDIVNSASTEVFACDFVDNAARGGGGVSVRNATVVMTGSRFFGNAAWNVQAGNNVGAGGGVSLDGGNVSIGNSLFTGNHAATFGGGLMIDGIQSDQFAVTDCTFSNNSAEVGAGGVFDDQSNTGATLSNCVLWGNTDPNGKTQDAQIQSGPDTHTTSVRFSCVQGWDGSIDGLGTISKDPRFVDPDGPDDIPGNQDDNLHLSPGSPCVDAGNNWGVPVDDNDYDQDGITNELFPVDLDGKPRFNADENFFDPGCGVPVIVDMGAYEYQFDPVEDVIFADLNGDGSVGATDLLGLLVNWGPCAKGCCLADLDLDGAVGASDLLILLVNWG